MNVIPILDPEIFEDNFYHDNKNCILRLDSNILSWKLTGNEEKNRSYSVNIQDVFAIKNTSKSHYFRQNKYFSKSTDSSSTNINGYESLDIYYTIANNNDSKLKMKKLELYHYDYNIITKWIDIVSRRLKNETRHPKHLLLFINPFSGRKKAMEIYKKIVEPLFSLVGIRVEVIETQKANHVYEILVDNGWKDDIDGIVCIGGDGTFSEVVNGVISRFAKINDIDLNNHCTKIPFPNNIKLGIIPAGSTDTVAYTLHGTSDIQTAILHVINGYFMKTDVCSVHSEKSYLCSFISLMSYGYLGDVIKHSLNLRWMGPMRYDCAGIKQFLLHKSYEGTVKFLKEISNEEPQTPCSKNNCHCITKTIPSNILNTTKWELIRGKFFMVTAANISCVCDRSPNGVAPYCHFADGYLYLILIREVTFFNKLKLLCTLSSKRRLINELDFVEIHKTKCFNFETGYGSGIIPATSISSWNIDGELINNLHLFVQCHQQIINLFCRKKNI